MTKDTSSQEYNDLKTELRSLLISSQQGCNEQQLNRDYGAYNAKKHIPYYEMGYKNLLDLLRSMPDVARIDYSKSPIIIHGVADQSTSHIKEFVMSQKRKKNTRNIRRGGIHRSNYGTMYSRNRPTQYQPVSNGLHFQPYSQITNINRNPWDTPHIQNASINQQFTTISYSSSSIINNSNSNGNQQSSVVINKSSTAKAVASFPPKENQISSSPPQSSILPSIRATPTIDDNSSVMDDDLNSFDDEELAAFDAERANEHGEKIILLRKRIRQLLLKYVQGIWLTSVHKLYQKSFNEELNLEEFKLKNLMAFFDCVSDFVDSLRDRLPDSTDRLLKLKPNFIEATKREPQTLTQTESTASLSTMKDNQNIMNTDQTSIRLITNDIDRPIVDLSSFVSLDFHYKRYDYSSNEPFQGFLGDIEDPWSIYIGNIQFIPKRERMMAQLQDHYNQSSNQSIYVIPFEQLHINLSCVYYHTDKQYYRSFILEMDQTYNNDVVILKVYLVDYGLIIPDINYHINSTNLKFLHKDFSTLSTQVYECRLANIYYPSINNQWPNDAQQFILDCCQNKDIFVEVIGHMDSFYCIYLWFDQNFSQSMNQLLIEQGLAIEVNDTQYSEFEPISPKIQSNLINETNINHTNYINENLLIRPKQNDIEYNIEENNLKYFIISIEHAYYFVKQPFTKRPCLPCFEVARLLNIDETYVSQLNIIRETEIPLKESHQLFHDLHNLSESSKCPHINHNDGTPTIKLYDLSAIRDYLCKIKFKEGDVIDAFEQEYNNYERIGYWNEKKSFYISKDNLETHQKDLYQRKDIFNLRREQLVSLSKNHYNLSSENEIHTIEEKLNNINQELHSMDTIFPIINNNSSVHQSSSRKFKTTNNKMRDTRFRIARPFDQQFSLNIRFDHQLITNDLLNNDDDDDIEERFEDLHRITKNVLQFVLLESEISDKENQETLNEVKNILPDLITNNLTLNERIEIYNYCLQIIEYFQPIIRNYVQRTDLIDTIC